MIRKTLRSIFSAPLILLVRFYQVCISPLTPPSCRFTPTSSQYALEALRKYGPLKGSYLAVRRILKPGCAIGYHRDAHVTVLISHVGRRLRRGWHAKGGNSKR